MMSVVEKMINYLINQRSFALGYPAKAIQIVQASDYFLTSCLGSTLKLVAIIDLDKDHSKRAAFSEAELENLRIALRDFAYHAYGKRLGTSIEIWYLGKNASAILQEPNVIRTNTTKYKFWVSSWAFDTKKNQAICNIVSVRNFFKKRMMTKMLRKTFYAGAVAVALP